MLELYHAPMSTCSQKVRICLAEKGLEWVDRRLNLAKNEHLTPAYLTLNPNGVVPTLVHDGQPVVDSSVICEYLDEVFPEPPLGGATPIKRAEIRAWMRFLEEVPTTAIRAPSINKLFMSALPESGQRAFADFREKMPLRKHFFREMGLTGFSDAKVAESLERLRSTLERVQLALGAWAAEICEARSLG